MPDQAKMDRNDITGQAQHRSAEYNSITATIRERREVLRGRHAVRNCDCFRGSPSGRNEAPRQNKQQSKAAGESSYAWK